MATIYSKSGADAATAAAIDALNLGTAATTDADEYATAAQGALADSAVQPGDLGTAAAADAGDFATAAQGALADTAVQPEDLGTAAAADAGDFATAAQGAKADASDVDQITLTGDLALTIPEGHPAGQVYRCAITQDGVGGHTVTYDDLPLTIDTTAGTATLVEAWPNGDVTYPGAVGSGSGLDTEGVQDVVGAMVQQAGGTYDDAGGTITLPAGGGSSAITADDTPAAPAEGESASYFVTSAASWPAGLVWSTDPDGGVAPTITGTALVSMFTVSGITRAILGATFPALPDAVAPVVGTLASSSITETGFTLTVTGASDVGGLHAQPYSFDTGTGTFGAWQTPATLAVTGKTAGTTHTCRHKVRDAAGNETTGASITVSTVAADATAPTWTATFTMGTPTETSVVATASAMASDNVGVTGYEVSYNDGSTYSAITPSGSNFTLTGTAGTTYATTKLRAKDAAGNYSTPVLSVPSYTMATASALAAYRSHAEDPTARGSGETTATYTFTGVAIGEAAASRVVVVGITSRGGRSKSVASVTIGGVAATVTGFGVSAENSDVAWAYATVPTGTTADVVVVYNKLADTASYYQIVRCNIGVWSSSTAITIKASAFGANAATASGGAASDQVLAIGHWYATKGTSWTGVTEEWEVPNSGGSSFSSGGGSVTLAAAGDVAVSITDTTYDVVGLLLIGASA